MLVLARRQGESLRIGDDNKITVLNITINRIKLSVNDSEGVFLSVQETLPIKNGITVKLIKTEKSQVELGIIAPGGVKVDREEVVYESKKQKNQINQMK